MAVSEPIFAADYFINIMKTKYLLLTFLFCSLSFATYAQAPLKKNANQINAGLGFSGWGVPVYIGLDHGIGDEFTIGGEFSIRSYSDNYNQTKYNHRIIGLAANVNYHFNDLLELPSVWNVYGGANLGYYAWSSSSKYNGEGGSRFGFGLQLGGRYFFKKNLGVNLEFGGATVTSGGKFGITYLL